MIRLLQTLPVEGISQKTAQTVEGIQEAAIAAAGGANGPVCGHCSCWAAL